MIFEFTREQPGVAETDAPRYSDAHIKLARWLAGDHQPTIPASRGTLSSGSSPAPTSIGNPTCQADLSNGSLFDAAKSKRRARTGNIRSLAIAAASLLVITETSRAAEPNILADGDLRAIVSQLPADHPVGTNASVSL